MEWLYIACIVLAGIAMLVITLIIPVRRVHALRGELARELARAGRHPADGAVLVHRRRRGIPREGAHRRVGTLLNMLNDSQSRAHGADRGRRHGDHRPVHDQVGRAARAGHLVQLDRRISRSCRSGVTYLPIPVCRRRHAAVRDRAPLAGRAAADLVHLPRPAADRLGGAERGRPDSPGRLPGFHVHRASRWPMPWASRRWSPRCGSTSRWKR